MTEEIIIDECYFCDNGICNIYPWTCDYDGNCKDNNECKVKEILLELKRLEQENKELLETLTKGCYQNLQHECRIWELKESKYHSALEEIREMVSRHCPGRPRDVLDIINEVLE